MSKHLVTVEVDTDRNVYGNKWGADGETEEDRCQDSEVKAFVASLGGTPWDTDRQPSYRVGEVKPAKTAADYKAAFEEIAATVPAIGRLTAARHGIDV